MMYSLLWKPKAEGQLADAWTSAADRAAVTRASEQLETLLTFAPSAIGESRTLGQRVAFLPPLVVTFDVDEIARQVTVVNIKLSEPRSRGS